jgi:hypothetical protein
VCRNASENGQISLSAVVRVPTVTAAVPAANRSCLRNAGKTQKSTQNIKSSGESRLKRKIIQMIGFWSTRDGFGSQFEVDRPIIFVGVK